MGLLIALSLVMLSEEWVGVHQNDVPLFDSLKVLLAAGLAAGLVIGIVAA
jgi:hypothetical protein